MTDKETMRRLLAFTEDFADYLCEASKAERSAILCRCIMHLDFLKGAIDERVKRENATPD